MRKVSILTFVCVGTVFAFFLLVLFLNPVSDSPWDACSVQGCALVENSNVCLCSPNSLNATPVGAYKLYKAELDFRETTVDLSLLP